MNIRNSPSFRNLYFDDYMKFNLGCTKFLRTQVVIIKIIYEIRYIKAIPSNPYSFF